MIVISRNGLAQVNANKVLLLYKSFKNTFAYEHYLHVLHDLDYLLTLYSPTGRYGINSVPRAERYCKYCSKNDLEDEYHFVMICLCFTELRKIYLRPYYWKRPSMFKFIELLKSEIILIIFLFFMYNLILL